MTTLKPETEKPLQERAALTRMKLLQAAGALFDELGYHRTTLGLVIERAKLTKGALYFHYPSKEALAQAVQDAQVSFGEVPEQPCKVQQVVDVIYAFTERLLTDPLVRGSARLSTDQDTPGIDHSGPYIQWGNLLESLLEQAAEQGEILPHVDRRATAELLVGAYVGTQVQSRALVNRTDLRERVSFLLKNILPGFVTPGMLPRIDLAPDRMRRIPS